MVPCYNAARTLAATIESAIEQEGVAEIVVVDDGSSDESLAVARRFEPHIKVFTGPNRGVSSARNRGIAETNAEWILFLDSDDILLPGTLALRLESAKKNQADVVICDWEEMIDDGRGGLKSGPRRSVDWASLSRDAETAIAISVWATTAAIMYRRPLIERIGGFRLDLPVIQDARLLFDAAYHGAHLVHSDHVGSKYRVLPGSLSRRDPARFWEDILVNGQQIESLWRRRGNLSDAQQRAVSDIYNVAARGLLASEHQRFFEAIESQRKLRLPAPKFLRVAGPLANTLGLRTARKMISLIKQI